MSLEEKYYNVNVTLGMAYTVDRLELIKMVIKVINAELSRFEVRTGATALLSEVCEY